MELWSHETVDETTGLELTIICGESSLEWSHGTVDGTTGLELTIICGESSLEWSHESR